MTNNTPDFIWFAEGSWLLRCRLIGYAFSGGVEVEVILTGERVIGMPKPFGSSGAVVIHKSMLK